MEDMKPPLKTHDASTVSEAPSPHMPRGETAVEEKPKKGEGEG